MQAKNRRMTLPLPNSVTFSRVALAKASLEALLAEKNLLGPRALMDDTGLPPAGYVTGRTAWDGFLGRGFEKGTLGEIVGQSSSGRTAIALELAARATRSRGDLVAWVDPLDRLSPHAVAAAGVVLGRFLWIRGGDPKRLGRPLGNAVAATQALAASGLFDLVILDFGDVPDRLLRALPLAWGQRLLRAFEDRETAGLVLARRRFAASPRGLAVHLKAQFARFDPAGRGRILRGLSTNATRPFPASRSLAMELLA
jgi:hypothetical protein